MGQTLSHFLAEWDEEEEPAAEPGVEHVASSQRVFSKKKTALVLKNVPHGTASDYLEFYVDKVTGLSARGGDYELISKAECIYIVKFRSPIESWQLHNFKTKIRETKCNGEDIEVEEILPTRSVIISNITETKRNQKYLEEYFSDPKKSGAHRFDSLELLEDDQVLVHFEDSESAQDLLNISHSILGLDVEILPYDRFTVYKENYAKSPSISHIDKKVSHVVAKFAQKCQPDLNASLESMHAAIQFIMDEDDSENVCIRIVPLKGSKSVSSWKEKCQDHLDIFLRKVNHRTLLVQPEILCELQKLIEKEQLNPSIFVELMNFQTTLYIAGYNENFEKFIQEFKMIEDRELLKEECITLDAAKADYISQTQVNVLKEYYPNINFGIDDNAITITGKRKDRESFKQHLNKMKVASTPVSANQQILNYLSGPDGITIINRLMHEAKEQFAVYIDMDKVYIVASDRGISSKVAKHIRQKIGYIPIKTNSSRFEEKHFSELCEELKRKYVVEISISLLEIEIIGDNQDIIEAERVLREHICKIYCRKKIIDIKYGCWRFISEKLADKWKEIIGKHKADADCIEVKIIPPKSSDDSRPEIILEGEESIITTLYNEINTLIKDSVFTNDPPLVIDQPGLFDYLSTNFSIKAIENDVPCCIEVTLKSLESREICEGITKEGKRIILIEGNLEDFRVDAIVNAANKALKHGGGVASAISKKGGPKIQRDSDKYIKIHGELSDGAAIIMDEVGDLPCKNLIHAVGPRWKNDGKVEKLLETACINSLKLANKCNCKTIAFPAICSGIFGFTVEVSANTMIQAFCTWSEEFPDEPLNNIYVVVHGHAILAFINAIKKLATTFQNASEVTNETYLMATTATPNKMDVLPVLTITDHEAIKLYRGELLNQQAEVYVNTTSTDLILSNGEVSKSILRAGGQAIQDECKQYVSTNGNVEAGDIVVTGPGNIPCKFIIHTVGAKYNIFNISESETVLKEIIEKCLTECEQKGAHSIAFPALGAGSLGYPVQLVAEAMISAVQDHYRINTSSCITEVKFVIFKDSTYKVFEKLFFEHTESELTSTDMSDESQYHSEVPVTIAPSTLSIEKHPTKEGKQSPAATSVKLFKGELLKQQAEVYVNTTSTDLILSNGEVSKSILSAGGQAIQDECKQYVSTNGKLQYGNIVVTGPGNIPCKFIIHTAGARYNSSNISESEKLLEGIVQKCLRECEQKGACSIAFPAVGAGNLGYPSQVVAKVMISAVQDYYKIYAASCITEVKFIIFMDDTYREFEKQLHGNLSTVLPSTTIDPSRLYGRKKPVRVGKRPSTATTATVPIKLYKGELLKQQAEVYVNTTSTDLILSNGEVSKSILRVGGQAIQDECKQYVSTNGNVQAGDIAVTGPGNIPCKCIIHTVGVNYDKSNVSKSEKILEEIVHKCLQVCEQRSACSIAFPSLGTGNLGYPPKIVAKVMITTVQNYFKTYRTTCIRSVKFIIFIDNIFKEFASLLSQQSDFTLSNHGADIPEILPSMSLLHSSVPLWSATETFRIGAVVVQVVCGDINNDDSDVIVNATQSIASFQQLPPRTQFQKARVAMQQSHQMYIGQHKQLAEGSIFITQATGSQLKCKLVFHAVVPNTKKHSKINQTVTSCLKQAECNELMSIAIPAIGIEELSCDPKVVAHGMHEAIIGFEETQPIFLRQVRIVILQLDKYQVFLQKFYELFTGKVSPSQPNVITKCVSLFKNRFTSKKSGTAVKPLEYSIPKAPAVQITIYAMSPSVVQTAEERVKKNINEQFTLLSIENKYKFNLNQDQISQLTQKAAEDHLIISINPKLSQIQIKGRKDKALILESTINEMLHNMEKEAITEAAMRREAELNETHRKKEMYLSFQRKVTWQYILDDGHEDYDPELNYQIEEAYQLYKTQGKFAVYTYIRNKSQFNVYFDKNPMVEEDCTSKEFLPIQRIDVKAEFPSSWGSNCDEIRLVPLSVDSPEYNKVQNGFKSSVDGKNISEIKRIQNPKLYSQYLARKRIMDKANPGTVNERRLYHGCRGEVVEDIAHNGFNRNFAGLHATKFGKGVYFAVNAKYSANDGYSKPDPNGNKHIFVALVLTGKYAKGEEDLKTPPPIDPKNPLKLYDSVVDNPSSPTMFVVFYDAQCYPEYLITFK